jgi:hypothetical protein
MHVKDLRTASVSRSARAGLFGVAMLTVVGLTTVGLSGCSTDSRSAQDAYRIGCPALDAAVAGGGTVKDATIKGLEIIRDSGQLDRQPQEWLETAIRGLTASSPKDLPTDARKTLVDGCADHGYPLKDL